MGFLNGQLMNLSQVTLTLLKQMSGDDLTRIRQFSNNIPNNIHKGPLSLTCINFNPNTSK